MTYFSRQNKAKKFILVLFFLGLLSLATIKFVYAQATDSIGIAPTSIPTAICDATDDFRVCAGKWAKIILEYLIFLAVAFAVIMIAYAGVAYIIFGDNKSAKDRIISAVVGLVIAFIAYVFVRMIVNTLIK